MASKRQPEASPLQAQEDRAAKLVRAGIEDAIREFERVVTRYLAEGRGDRLNLTQINQMVTALESIAQQYPQYADQIVAAAKQSFVDGQDWAYAAGIVAVVLGALLVWFMFPRRDDEQRLLAEYQASDALARS